jgi:hypothetical protein
MRMAISLMQYNKMIMSHNKRKNENKGQYKITVILYTVQEWTFCYHIFIVQVICLAPWKTQCLLTCIHTLLKNHNAL